jgi:DnaJ-domain-containing protein 1
MKLEQSSHIYLDARKSAQCDPSNHLCGSVCVSKKKKCKSSTISNPTEAAFSKGRKALQKANDQIRSLPKERTIAINPTTGESLFSHGGNETSVNIPQEDISKLKGAYLTHNHPNLGTSNDDPRSKGYSFSHLDFKVAAYAQVAEIHAVSRGFDHVLSPPREGWNAQWFERKGWPVYQKHYGQVYRELIVKTAFRGMDARLADRELWHVTMDRTAKELGMNYSRKEVRRDSFSFGAGVVSDLVGLGLPSSYIDGFSVIRSDKKCGGSNIPDNKVCRKGGAPTNGVSPAKKGAKTPEVASKSEETESDEAKAKRERRRKNINTAIALGVLGAYYGGAVHLALKAKRQAADPEYEAKTQAEANRRANERANTPKEPSTPWHKTLGVKPNASPEEIRQAYKKKARELHPDINKSPDAEEKFKQVNAANEWAQYKKKMGKYKKDGLVFGDIQAAYKEAQAWHPWVPADFW